MRIRAALLIVCVVFATASAETPLQEADRLFTEGRALLTQNDSAGACEKFEAAIKLDPTATGTMLNLGLCYENLEKFATSIKWFRKAQAAASENKLTEYEAAAKEHTAIIASKVSTLNLTVDGPPDSELLLTGIRIEPTSYARVEVDAGSLEIVGRAPGKKPVTVTVTVAIAEHQAATITISEDVDPEFIDRGKQRRKNGLIIAGSGTLALGGVLVWGLIERNKQQKIDDDPTITDKGGEKQASNDRLKFGMTPMFVVASGAVVAGVILYLTAPGKERVRPGMVFTPVVSPDEVGFAFSGSF